jgi:DNA-nicking Smr family endonuclease
VSRRLSDEDREVWDRVTRSTRRLRPSPDPRPDTRTGPVPDPEAPPPGLPTRPPVVKTDAPRRNRPVAHDLALPLDQALAAAPLRMDAGLHRRLKRGKLAPEGRIDLHGMTRAQAQPALTGFLLGAHARGERLVLVITGKGREPDDDDLPVPRRPGALRHDLPHWLAAPALRAIVLDLRPAHRSHGGGGAFYVYLRRSR